MPHFNWIQKLEMQLWEGLRDKPVLISTEPPVYGKYVVIDKEGKRRVIDWNGEKWDYKYYLKVL